MDEQGGYWERHRITRLPRRRFLSAAGAGIAGLTAAGALACGQRGATTPQPKTASGGSGSAGQPVAGGV
ncbi:MAG TPA: hypothetical protein VK821_02080, partial [Dehalococcoidia bacterium]|nr:hypothetical protein [Dehalococcoidia bacterium]